MEDAAGGDLDWFWHSWFYTTKHVDIGITNFTRHILDLQDPDNENKKAREEKEEKAQKNVVAKGNKRIPKYVDQTKD